MLTEEQKAKYKERRNTPEQKEKIRAYSKKRYQDPKIAEKSKEQTRLYKNRPHVKLKIKQYNSEYSKKPEVVEKKKEKCLLEKYNLTLDEWNKLYDEQNGCCKICKRHESEFKYGLAVDHCHDTDKIRGLLCANCNRGLGYLKDSVELLELAIQYLKSN